MRLQRQQYSWLGENLRCWLRAWAEKKSLPQGRQEYTPYMVGGHRGYTSRWGLMRTE